MFLWKPLQKCGQQFTNTSDYYVNAQDPFFPFFTIFSRFLLNIFPIIAIKILREGAPAPPSDTPLPAGKIAEKGVYFWLYGIAYWMPIQQKLPPPVLLFSDFAGRDVIKYYLYYLFEVWIFGHKHGGFVYINLASKFPPV